MNAYTKFEVNLYSGLHVNGQMLCDGRMMKVHSVHAPSQ